MKDLVTKKVPKGITPNFILRHACVCTCTHTCTPTPWKHNTKPIHMPEISMFISHTLADNLDHIKSDSKKSVIFIHTLLVLSFWIFFTIFILRVASWTWRATFQTMVPLVYYMLYPSLRCHIFIFENNDIVLEISLRIENHPSRRFAFPPWNTFISRPRFSSWCHNKALLCFRHLAQVLGSLLSHSWNWNVLFSRAQSWRTLACSVMKITLQHNTTLTMTPDTYHPDSDVTRKIPIIYSSVFLPYSFIIPSFLPSSHFSARL